MLYVCFVDFFIEISMRADTHSLKKIGQVVKWPTSKLQRSSPVVFNHSSQSMSKYNQKNHSSDKFAQFGYVGIILLIQIK